MHSTMIQERRSMLKVWNAFLIMLTFFLLFGTFLTRAGIISSIHAFAQVTSGFIWVYGAVVAASVGLILWRLPLLEQRASNRWQAAAAFVINNWARWHCCHHDRHLVSWVKRAVL